MCFTNFWQDLTSAPVTCHFRSIYCTTLNFLQFLQDLGESPTNTNRFSFHNIHMISYDWDAIPNLVFDLDNPNQLSLKIFSTSEIQYCYFHRAVPWSPLPVMTPSSPNTTPLPHLGRCCFAPNSGWSEWSSLGEPQPKPGRRRMTWETR